LESQSEVKGSHPNINFTSNRIEWTSEPIRSEVGFNFLLDIPGTIYRAVNKDHLQATIDIFQPFNNGGCCNSFSSAYRNGGLRVEQQEACC